MSGAEASYAKFSNSPLVRGDNSNFEPSLFNKVGGIRGCTGATNSVAAANSNPGDNYKLVGGAKTNYVLNTNLPNLQLHKGGKKRRKSRRKHRRSSRHRRSKHRRRRHKRGGNPSAVPSSYANGIPHYGFKGADLSTTSKLAPGHAPVKMGYNTSCKGGARRRRTYKKRGSKKYTSKNFKKHYMWNTKGKRYTAKTYKQHMRGVKLGHTHTKPKRKSKRRRHRMKGGYSQFMSNVPYSASYSTGGHISPSDLALANPVPHQRFVNCPGK